LQPSLPPPTAAAAAAEWQQEQQQHVGFSKADTTKSGLGEIHFL
jgi:hypothetical protein